MHLPGRDTHLQEPGPREGRPHYLTTTAEFPPLPPLQGGKRGEQPPVARAQLQLQLWRVVLLPSEAAHLPEPSLSANRLTCPRQWYRKAPRGAHLHYLSAAVAQTRLPGVPTSMS